MITPFSGKFQKPGRVTGQRRGDSLKKSTAVDMKKTDPSVAFSMCFTIGGLLAQRVFRFATE
jgi:hypothetical protein